MAKTSSWSRAGFDALLTPRGNTWGVHPGRVRPKKELLQRETVGMLEAFIDAPSRHKSLTIFPVVAKKGPALHLLISTEIDGEDVLTLRERGDGASPMLLARNNSFHDLLIPAGEPLPGVNQGRLAARSFLIGGKSVIQLPEDSWRREDRIPPRQESEITQWVEHFPLQKQQVGILACLGTRVLGLEALGCTELYKPLHRRLLIRFIKEALSRDDATSDEGETPESPPDWMFRNLEGEARKVVASLEDADRLKTKRIGAADYLKLSGPVTGGELIHQGSLIHLTARPLAPFDREASGKEG